MAVRKQTAMLARKGVKKEALRHCLCEHNYCRSQCGSFSKKLEAELLYGPPTTLGYRPGGFWIYTPQRNMRIRAAIYCRDSRRIHQGLKPQENGVHVHHQILISCKEKWYHDIWRKMNKTGNHCVQQPHWPHCHSVLQNFKKNEKAMKRI